MKKNCVLTVLAVGLMGIVFTSCDSSNSYKSVKLKSEVDSVSYILGKAQASNMKAQMDAQMESWPIKGNVAAYMSGFQEGLKVNDSIFLGKNMDEATLFINNFFQNMQERASENKKVEEAQFLAENKNKSGVRTTASGLQYQVITEGTGPKPKSENTVKVHYHGTFLDGTVFDSSVEREEPMDFSVDGVIPGMSEAIQLMSVGSKYKIWIPIELGYGTTRPQFDQLLIFDVELLEIM